MQQNDTVMEFSRNINKLGHNENKLITFYAMMMTLV